MLKRNYQFLSGVVCASVAYIHLLSPATSQELSNNFTQLQALLEARKWYEADQETTSLIRNNSENLSCSNLNTINQLWMNQSNGKYGLTAQRQIWQQVGGFDCQSCQGEIRKFSEKVGWNLSEQVTPLPGDFVAQYPTVATLGWQRYVDSDRSLFKVGIFGRGTWQDWKISGFNIFSVFKNCEGKTKS